MIKKEIKKKYKKLIGKWDTEQKRMINYIEEYDFQKLEYSPSNKSKCIYCREIIGKGTPRAVKLYNYGIHLNGKYIRIKTPRYVCGDCFIKESVKYRLSVSKNISVMKKHKRKKKKEIEQQNLLRIKTKMLEKLN